MIPSTAVLTLSHIYDYQTRPLFVHDKVKPEQKTIRNLFYISLHEDELPTYHFWTSPEDPDPVERQGVDWSIEFGENPASPRTAARIAELERDRHLRAQAAQLQDDENDDSDENEGAIDDESGPEDGETEPPAWQYDKPITTVMQDAGKSLTPLILTSLTDIKKCGRSSLKQVRLQAYQIPKASLCSRDHQKTSKPSCKNLRRTIRERRRLAGERKRSTTERRRLSREKRRRWVATRVYYPPSRPKLLK